MAEVPLKNQIVDWLKTSAYWFQYAGNAILENGVITSELVNTTYEYFKEDMGLVPTILERKEIDYKEVETDITSVEKPLYLKTIKDILHVNALASGQSIEIGSNLTVIYGGNGTGKSGYIRMLNNAFDSRGDKRILGNVYDSSSTGTPSCSFVFDDGTSQNEISFPTDSRNPAFQKFGIFDTQSVRVHLENDNKLNFTPVGFEFFELLDILYDELRKKLNSEILLNKPPNGYLESFTNENIVKQAISDLNFRTDIEELKKIAGLTEEEAELFKQKIARQKELKELDIPKKINGLQELKNSLNDFIAKQQLILDYLKADNISQYQNLLKDHAKFTELTKQEGISAFAQYNIAEIGSPEWQAFVKASRVYAEHLEHLRGGEVYPSQQDTCLLCLRPLGDAEKILFDTYWSLLKSEAGRELQRINGEIIETIQILSGLTKVPFDESTVYYNHVNTTNPELANRWKEISETANIIKNSIVTNLGEKSLEKPMQEFNFNTDELNPIVLSIQTEIDKLQATNTAKELADLESEITLFSDRHLLGRMLNNVLQLVGSYKWAAQAEAALTAFNTTAITKKQGDLFSSRINDKYTTLFNSECDKLRAPKVVSIVQKNAKISSFRKLQINGIVANNVLSEGEQRAISLADFLTEAQLNPNNKGLFFDDPVTSQDHIRKEHIADRLVSLSASKQVIVFTHDISFFLRLQTIAKRMGISCDVTTIRNIGNKPGIVRPDLPWIAQKLSDRIKYLRNQLVSLKAVESAGNPDEYLMKVKLWYELYREAWERAVEERLFKGAVERFGYGVQTQKLKYINITADMLADIDKGMSDSSDWVHDQSAGRNIEPPDTNQAESDLTLLDEFAKKCPAP
ncbi:AAA family ATPase [Flavobacterium sp.]